MDRLESTIEAHILAAAAGAGGLHHPRHLRAHRLAVPRQAVDEGRAARGRSADRGVDRGRQRRARSSEFANAVGFPLILKPRSGAGARGHHPRRLRRPSSTQALGVVRRQGVDSIAVEEFVEGHEGFYDTFSIDGGAAADFVLPLLPQRARGDADPLDLAAVHHHQPDRVGWRDYGELREMGQRVIEALGIGTWATHMEWFFGPKGLRFSEIGCRPPGVGAWDLYSAGNDLDLYREWANAIVHGAVSAPPSRRYAAGIVALRPEHDGQISGYSGVEEIQAAVRRVGPRRAPARPRHADPARRGRLHGQRLGPDATPRLRRPARMLDDVGRTITVHAA